MFLKFQPSLTLTDKPSNSNIVEDTVKVRLASFFFVAFGTTALLLHSRSLESFGLGRLFPDNPSCGNFMVFLFRSTSNMKMFAFYLFRRSQKEISPGFHVSCLETKTKSLHLLGPFTLYHIHCPSNLIISDPGYCPWLEDFA